MCEYLNLFFFQIGMLAVHFGHTFFEVFGVCGTGGIAYFSEKSIIITSRVATLNFLFVIHHRFAPMLKGAKLQRLCITFT